MRNLKRALSLALASVMLLGMMVVGTSASYTDVDSKDNKEAIEVLQAVGIMTGDDKGNFNPDQKVTRNEMAVIMCNLLDYTVASYKGTSKFTDVPAWAEPYVAACYTNGIIAGYSTTTFGGNDAVTTGQAALMLMKSLGYFQYASDFGDDWLVATTSQGAKINLFDDIDNGAREALTRNDVAQMVLNTLKATMVEYSGNGGTTVKGDGFEITTGKATYDDRTSKNTKYAKFGDDPDNSGKYTVELGEELYSGDLTKDTTNGLTGAPATKWEYKGDEIGTYADTADKTYVVDDADKTLTYFLTDNDYFKYSSKKADTATDKNSYLNGDELDIDGDKLEKGDVISVYLKDNDVDTIEAVVVLRYTAAIIDDIDTDISKSQKNDGVNAIVTLKKVTGDKDEIGYFYDTINASASQKEKDKQLNGYLGTSYKKDAAIAIAQNAKGVIVDSYAINVVTGKVTSVREAEYVTPDDNTSGIKKGFVKVDGTTYNFAGSVNGTVKGFDFDKEYTVYTTAEGYALAISGAGASLSDVYYVTGLYMVKNNYGTETWYAQAVLLSDGTVKEIKLDSDFVEGKDTLKLSDILATVGGAGADKDNLKKVSATNPLTGEDAAAKTASDKTLYVTKNYLYTFDDDGVPSIYTDSDYKVLPGALTDDMKKADSRIKINSTSYYADSTTKYVGVEKTGDDIDVTTAVGGMSAEKNTDVVLVADGRDAKYVVYVSNNLKGAQEDIVYLTGKPTEKNNDGWVKSIYFMDTNKSETVTLKSAYAPGFYTYSINSDGVYELTKASSDALKKADENKLTDSDTEGWISGLTITERGGTMLTGTFTDADSTSVSVKDMEFGKALVMDKDDDAHSKVYDREINSVSRLKSAIDAIKGDDKNNAGSVVADVYVTDGEITFVYVTSMTAKTAK